MLAKVRERRMEGTYGSMEGLYVCHWVPTVMSEANHKRNWDDGKGKERSVEWKVVNDGAKE